MTEENLKPKKAYILGKITGISIEKLKSKFDVAEKHLIKIGIVPVNPIKSKAIRKQSREKKLINQIDLLLGCNTIFVLDNWFDCDQSRIKMKIAVEYGMEVIYESDSYKNASQIEKMKEAIKDVMGFDFEEYTKMCRKNEYFYARMIFINHCKFYENMSLYEIGDLVNRDHSTIMHSIKQYRNEIKYNVDFRKITIRVNIVLNNIVSQ